MNNYSTADCIIEWDGEEFDWDQMLAAADSEDDFIVDGVISSATTLLYGESKVGKSYLACALIAAMVTGGQFLGKEVEPRDWKVAILATDDRAEREYGKRIRTVLPEGVRPPIRTFRLPVMRAHQKWKSLHTRVLEQGYNFVVIDSLTQAINGTINSDETIRDFFDGVRLFVNSGIPVLVVAHSSEKTGPHGKSDNPLGSSTITQSVRHRVYAYRQNGRVFLKFKGNHIEDEYRMTLAPGTGARFTVLEEKSMSAVAADKRAADEAKRAAAAAEEAAKQERSKATLDTNEQKAKFVVDECQGMKPSTVAKKLFEKFGGAVSTYTSSLSASRGFASMLEHDPATHTWTLAA